MKLKSSYETYLFNDDDAVLVSTESSEFAGFLRGNETTAFIVNELKHETTQEEIVRNMVKHFDAPYAVVERDVVTVIAQLASIGALEEAAADGETGELKDDTLSDKPTALANETPESASGSIPQTTDPLPQTTDLSPQNPDPLPQNTRSFEDELRAHGSFVFRNVGSSMRPLIKQGRDLVVIHRKPEGRCKKYDVVLYKRNQRYVLHRIVEVLPDGYVICGDNCINKEYDITDKDIIGVMTALVRKGVRIPMTNSGPVRYARAWCSTYPLRRPIMKARALAGKIVRSTISSKAKN